MILGVGVDIVSIERIKEKLKRNNAFKTYVFSEEEIKYCEAKARPAESYAVRFAAKEAFLKAVGQGLLVNFELNQLEVKTEEMGLPFFSYSDEVSALLISKWGAEPHFHLSLSHEDDKGIAFVVIEKR